MLFHGIDKFLHPGSVGYIGQNLVAMNLPAQLAYGVYVGELIAALMLMVGAFSRLGALLIIVNMLVAIGLMHSNELLSLSKHGGWALELQGFYLFGALAIVFLGSGRLALKPD